MAHIQHLDELVREYLLFRGFTITLKSFDAELKVEKDRGFRVDRIVDQFVLFVNNYDLQSLRDLWTHFDQKLFTKLEQDFIPGVRKLESSLLKFYLVNAVVNNKTDKIVDFFTKMTPEIQGQQEWKDWFVLPYIKNPEEHPPFMVHFTKQWQDTFLVSLHNFLAITFQIMPKPALASYEEEATKLRRLQEENEALKQKLGSVGEGTRSLSAPEGLPPIDIMDDFYIIAQETPPGSGDSSGKSLKSLMRTIGGGIPTSPILGRKPPPLDEQVGIHKHGSGKRSQGSWMRYGNSVDGVPKRSLSLDSRTRKGNRDPSVEAERRGSKKDNFLLLSQEQMTEHKSAVIECRFNATGSLVASCDSDGILKVWSPSPVPNVFYSAHFKPPLATFCWVAKNERFFISGSEDGTLRLHDAKEHKIVWEILPDENSPLKDSRVLSLSCSQTERILASTMASSDGSESKLLIYDIKSLKLEQMFSLENGVMGLCCELNHNGSVALVGCSDGGVRTVDVRRGELLETRPAHSASILSIRFSVDHNTFFTFAADHTLCRHSLALESEPNWTSSLPKCSENHTAQSFTLHQNGKHILTACGDSGTNIYQITNNGLQLMLHLRGHNAPLTACDWSTANQCVTCLSASSDGYIKISTILTP